MSAIADVFVAVHANTDGVGGEIEQGTAKPAEKAGRKISEHIAEGMKKNQVVLQAAAAAAGTIVGTGVVKGAVALANNADGVSRFANSLGDVNGGLAALGVGAGALGVAATAAQGLAGASDILAGATDVLSASKAFFTTTTNAETGAVTASGIARAKDLVITLAHTAAAKAAAVAAKVFAAGQWLVNAALTANPIGLVIVGVAALVAGFILAYKKSETFRGIVNKLWDALRKFIGFTPLGLLIGQFDHIKDAVSWLLGKLGDLGDKLKHLPGAGVLGKIPGFARGGVLRPGLSLVGERGPELIASARGGQRVYTHAQSRRMSTGAAGILAAWDKMDRLDGRQLSAGYPRGTMRFNPKARLDTSQITERRPGMTNSGRHGGITIHGGINVVAHRVDNAGDAVARKLRNLSHRLGF